MKKEKTEIKAAHGEDDWEIEDGLRTLMRAKEIQADKDLLNKILNLANKKKGQINSIAELRGKLNDHSEEESEQEETV